MRNFINIINEGHVEDLISAYVKEDGRGLYEIQSYFDVIHKKYPFEGGTLYRGLNFDTREQYLNFRRSIKDGYITSGRMSSWAKNQDSAQAFAQAKQVYIPTRAVMHAHAEYEAKKERIMGFIGVILKIEIGPNDGLDIAHFGAEDEVLVRAGSYKILEIINEKSFKHLLKGQSPDASISNWIDSGEKITPEVQYFLTNHYEQISPQVMSKMKEIAKAEMGSSFNFILNPKEEYFDGINANSGNEPYHLFTTSKEMSIYFGKTRLYRALNEKDQIDVMRSLDTKRMVSIINRATKGLDSSVYLSANKYQIKGFSYQTGITISELPHLKKYFTEVYRNFNIKMGEVFNTHAENGGRRLLLNSFNDIFEILTALSGTSPNA